MKKVWIFMLAVSLFCTAGAWAESEIPYVPLEDQGNLVLDIPWGISANELCTLFKEKTGWELLAGDKVDGVTPYYRTPEEEEITFLGEPCTSIRFIINGVPVNAKGEFMRVAIVEYPALEGITSEEVVRQTEKMLSAYSDHYGPMHHANLQVGDSMENTQVFFDFPGDENGKLNQEELLLAAQEIGVINIVSCFENISLAIDVLYVPELDFYLWRGFALFSQPTEENMMPIFHDLDSLGSFREFYETKILPGEASTAAPNSL